TMADVRPESRKFLKEALHLSGADFNRLAPFLGKVVAILRRLNVRAVLQTDTDFLGMFYEAFLRYGYDNNALGIVFTPRHITRFCVGLAGVAPNDRVIDIACGTGGFLVAAFDKMKSLAKGPTAINKIKESLHGFDTNPTVWALSVLNMFFRGDGKSHIEHSSCFDKTNRKNTAGRFSRSFLNPPFSQDEEPEKDFIDAAMDALEPGGIMAAVVYAGIFADEDHKDWRKQFLRKHKLLGMISLPEDLFYPTAAPTTIIVAEAHHPQEPEDRILMARVWNDGFTKLKNRRVEQSGDQLPVVLSCFERLRSGQSFNSPIACTVLGSNLREGAEWSPQQWLPQPPLEQDDCHRLQRLVIRSIYQAVAQFPDLADEVLEDFASGWQESPAMPVARTERVDYFFEVLNGKSTGEKNYSDGTIPYISSGDTTNSIINLVSGDDAEMFQFGGITVTAFGQASVQPWSFLARGNGGSAVRVLVPKFNMSIRELGWFAAQINYQRWRFFYARMSIKSRLERLMISSPTTRMPDGNQSLYENVRSFRTDLDTFSAV
ncbi:MAG: N-6 DNA methylase, partial [Bryobacterales bacterium]|nr:N-6 DNA methylase [Bryobacterales bacterium]